VSVAYFAIRSRQMELLALLLDHGGDPTAALTTAAWEAHVPAIDLLIARGARVDAAVDGDRPLLNNLVRWGQFKQAADLLRRGASPNLTDAQGWTALHQAVSRGNANMLRALLDAGADVTRRNNAGATPLAMAKALGRPPIVALLDKGRPR
jgi:ankyrin repeat protein